VARGHAGSSRVIRGVVALATTEGHHVHAHFDRRSDRAVGSTRDFIEYQPTRLEIGLGFTRSARYYQSCRCTAVGPKGELLTSREAAYYSQDRGERAFDIGSSTTWLTPTGYPSGRQQGIRAHFDMSTPSPNGFRPLRATLTCPAEDGARALIIDVSARVAGKDVFGRVTLGGGAGLTMDVATTALEAEGVASP